MKIKCQLKYFENEHLDFAAFIPSINNPGALNCTLGWGIKTPEKSDWVFFFFIIGRKTCKGHSKETILHWDIQKNTEQSSRERRQYPREYLKQTERTLRNTFK